MKSYFEKRHSLSDEILNMAKNIFRQVEKIIAKTSYTKIDHLADLLKQIAEEESAIKSSLEHFDDKREGLNILLYFSGLFDKFNSREKRIADYVEIVTTPAYLAELTQSMSQTFTKNVNSDASNLKSAMIKFKDDIVKRDGGKYLGEIYAAIAKDDLTIINYFRDDITLNDFNLFVAKKYIKSAEGDVAKSISAQIEKMKDAAIGAEAKQMPRQENFTIVQQLISRFNLWPETNYMSIAELIDFLFRELATTYNENISDAENILALTRGKKKIGLLHFRRYSPNFIEFRIRSLINREYINKKNIMTTMTSGLNQKSIERYKTIHKIAAGDEVAANDKIEFHVNGVVSDVLIIDSLNNNLHRVMVSSRGIFAKYNFCEKIVRGVTTRPINYNKIAEDELLANFDEKSMLVEEHRVIKAPNPAPIIEKIKIQCKKIFAEIYDSAEFSTQSEFIRGITRDTVVDKILSIISQEVYNVFILGKFYHNEILLTVNRQIFALQESFRKSYINNCGRIKIAKYIFDDKNAKSSLGGYFNDIIWRTTDEIQKNTELWNFGGSLKEYYFKKYSEKQTI